jgi:hypothetical protein
MPQDPGHLIATYFLLLYIILGPLVLFSIYVLFDSFSKTGRPENNRQGATNGKNEPALWTKEDISAHINRI